MTPLLYLAVLSLCSGLVAAFVAAPTGLALSSKPQLRSFRHGSAAPLARMASEVQPAQRRSAALANGQFPGVARSDSGLLEELARRDVFSTPPKRNDGRKPEFEANLGKVIDTLRSDYPLLFHEPLDYSIYVKDIVVKDPTGVVFKGIGTCELFFILQLSGCLHNSMHTSADTYSMHPLTHLCTQIAGCLQRCASSEAL
jgi:Uncharacterized conserved protein (DUF2358)